VNPLSAQQLFERFFLPLYPPKSDLAELRSKDVNPAQNPRILAQLDDIAETFAKLAPKELGADPELDFSDASVHRLAALLTRERRDALLEGEPIPPLVQLVTHGAVYVGACAVRNHGGRWTVRNPLWESRVELRSRAGVGELALFQWWLKSLSDDEIAEPRLADRYRLHVEIPSARPEELPILAPADRKLPRLGRVRYDTLHKYLRAHLPELTDVGDHFPSPERFHELGLEWLDFLLLGGGRMLLMHGPGENRVRTEGDKLVVEIPVLGSTEVHEMLWWGS
jgi:hypothetical protein